MSLYHATFHIVTLPKARCSVRLQSLLRFRAGNFLPRLLMLLPQELGPQSLNLMSLDPAGFGGPTWTIPSRD